MRFTFILLLLCLTLPKFQTINAQTTVPNFMPYQGFLADTNGNPVNGRVSLTFKLYENEFDMAPIWQQNASIEVSQGSFAIYLGERDEISGSLLLDHLKTGQGHFLGLTLDNDSELLPRQKLGTMAYSFLSANSIMLANRPASDYVLSSDVSNFNFTSEERVQELIAAVGIDEAAVNALIDARNYINEEAINALIDARNYLNSDDVGALIDARNYLNEENVDALIDARNYLNSDGVNALIDARNYLNSDGVNALIDARNYLNSDGVNALIDARNYLDTNGVNALIDVHNYLDTNGVNALIDARNYLDTNGVNALIDARNYVTEVAVNILIDARNYLNANGVNALIDARNYVTEVAVNALIDARNYLTTNEISTLINTEINTRAYITENEVITLINNGDFATNDQAEALLDRIEDLETDRTNQADTIIDLINRLEVLEGQQNNNPGVATTPHVLGATNHNNNDRVEDGGFQYNNLTGLEAAYEMCQDAFPNDTTAHMCSVDEIVYAVSSGAVDAIGYDVTGWIFSTAGNRYGSNLNNCHSFLYNSGHIASGTTARLGSNVLPGGVGGLRGKTVDVNPDVGCGGTLPVLCCR